MAINAKATNKRYSMFDVAYEQQELVTEKEREAANATPKTIQEVMKNVVAFVEVRSGHEDRTESIKTIMKMLGATVCDRITKKTTHVIFKGGRLSTYQKAEKLGIPLVPIMWIEACKKHLVLVDPKEFSVSDKEMYENPELYKLPRCTKIIKTDLTFDESPSMPQIALKPLVFHTPYANALQKELSDMSKKLEDVLRDGEPELEPINEAVVDLTQCDSDLNRRKTICGPEVSQSKIVETEKKESAGHMDKKTWIQAIRNFKNLTDTSKKVETEVKEEQIDTAKAVATPSVKDKVPKRRTLFTPPVECNTFKLTTPSAVVKPEKRRRTLYTPSNDLMSPPIVIPKVKVKPQITPQTKQRQTIFTSAPTTKSKITINSSQCQGSAQTTSKQGQSTSIGMKMLVTDTPKASTANQTGRTVAKRKLYDAGYKENTPPRLKMKQFLTPTLNQTSKMKNPTKLGPLIPAPEAYIDLVSTPPKRRRTLVPMTH